MPENGGKGLDRRKAHPTPFPASGFGGGSPEDSGGGVLAASQGATVGQGARRTSPATSGGPAASDSGSSQTGVQAGVQGTLGGGPEGSLANAQAAPPPASLRNHGGQDWAAALELTIATHGAEPYKSRLRELFTQMITPEQMDGRGWTAVRALPYLGPGAKEEMRAAVRAYLPTLDQRLAETPFGVPPSLGTWGGSGAVVNLAIRMYFLHRAFPDLVSPEYTLRVNYILGTHPVSSTSYVAGVGTVSKLKTYSNNRADNSYIPGAVIPGYIIIKPDFPECIDDFAFLWFEDEAVVAGSASWVVAGNAAAALTREQIEVQLATRP